MSEVPLKLCGKCRVVKPEKDFNRAGQGRQHWCRECFRAYFKARGKVHLEQVARSTAKRRDERRAFVQGYLREHPCTDCGETDLSVLEFDHVVAGVKEDDVSWLVINCMPIDLIKAEIRRCEVVCVNCHRRRTAARAGWLRLEEVLRHSPGPRPRQDRNIRFVYDYLRASNCVDCGEDDLVVLEFDHVGPKRANVVSLAWGEYSLETLRREIAQCEVRCANCHRRVTAERRTQDRARGK